MKTYINSWLLCLMLLFLGTVETHAQRFYFKQLFNSAKYKYGKKQTQKTFTPTVKLYNHQWELTVDGVLVKSSRNTDCLHVGKDKEKSQLIRLETKTLFTDVDLVRVCTDIAIKRRDYKVSMTLGSDNDNYSDTRNLTKDKDNLNNNLSIFYITEGNINSGTLKVEMKGEKYEEGALYLFFIEVASVLSDQQKLQTQHIKSGKTYSYQVQRTFASDHWNTICLPFNVDAETLKQAFGENCKVRQFTKVVENNVLKFDKTNAIKAGVPYLIKPKDKVKNPIFSNVVYKDVEPQTVQDETGRYAFVGTFAPVNLKVDGSELFLLANGNLAKPKSEEVSEMYGMRAYFKINQQTSSSAKQNTYAIDCGSETVNGIQSLRVHPSTNNQHIYNLQGVDVGTDMHHLPAGVYVVGGKKIMKR
ncbi:hypothetical protein HMPREF0650_0043 [Hoylesella buccalis ATCC 35310]|uniref:Uncharacterized protein n=1 Tax=Hoylesella buccalis ATCC 35310 TaxID=679190 RepID=D1W6V7_9BACT|nr:hypothetical protein [Hoylesella buccalis]EFA91727.1 hypothetical protein HMPREF0650_0043 [Hoylesella buccalis ATCC 35310]